jgi:hypothetical protein
MFFTNPTVLQRVFLSDEKMLYLVGFMAPAPCTFCVVSPISRNEEWEPCDLQLKKE